MLTITVAQTESFNETTQEFVYLDGMTLDFEHSLVSLSKWESIHQIPFLADNEKSADQMVDYIRLMILTPDVPDDILQVFSEEDFKKIQAYIDSPESATTFSETPGKGAKRETITAELIYYWMVAYNIPWEAETWHLNRLFSLIKIANIKQGPQKKMSKAEISAQNAKINAERKARLGTTG